MQTPVNLRNKFLPIIKNHGWSLEVFAEKCSLTKAGLINILNNNDTKISTLLTMCDVAQIPIESIFTSYTETSNVVEEPGQPYGQVNDKYLQCLENNNHLTTRIRQLEIELGALKKEDNKTPVKTK